MRSGARATLLGFALVALVVAPAWLALAGGPFPFGDVVAVVALALLPTLAVERRVPGRARRNALVVAVTALGATLVASAVAFDMTLADARPRDASRDFFGPMLGELRQGLLDFFDAKVPFDPVEYPGMRGAVLLGAFAFVALAGMAIAARRPFLALSALVVGAGWPATMVSTWVESSRPLLTGALILAAALALVLLLRPGTRALSHAALASAVLVAIAVAGSTTDAVAKRGFVDWDSWDFYDRPDDPVDVRYVWDADYGGIAFPKEKTTVLKVRMPGPKRSLYWRATTLDDYTGFVWREDLEPAREYGGEERIDVTAEADPLLPDAARDTEEWVEQEVEVRALEEERLVGSAQIVRWEPRTSAPARLTTNGSLLLPGPLRRGQRYKVWSYVPEAKPRQLNRTGTAYPEAANEFLAVAPGIAVLPAFGSPVREEFMEGLFRHDAFVADHEPLYRTAIRVTGEAETPYEAVVALESWFRGSEGQFVYDEQPPPGNGIDPPLVQFLQTKRGYCQHFAGAMAAMLRYIGVPARVAAGFTSGTYDEARREWTVTDHNAHTWVEAYFPGIGWVPFDPTPDRGELTAAYTPTSPAFDVRDAAELNSAALEGIPEIREKLEGRASLEEGSGVAAGEAADGGSSVVASVVRSVLGLVLLVGGLAAGLILLVKAVRRRARFATRDPRLLAAAIRRDLVAYVVDQGYAVPPSATLRELGTLVQGSFGVDTAPFVAALTDARYGPPETSRERARRARTELRRLRRRMSRGLRLGDRVRGALSLRSLAA